MQEIEDFMDAERLRTREKMRLDCMFIVLRFFAPSFSLFEIINCMESEEIQALEDYKKRTKVSCFYLEIGIGSLVTL